MAPLSIDSAALPHASWNPLHSLGMHFTLLHGIGCIQTQCMESTAFNRDTFYHAAWSALQSITMHGIHCIQSACFGPCCIKSTAFNHAAWNPLYSFTLQKSTEFNKVPFLHAPLNPPHALMLHGIHSIQSGCILPGCMESTAFNDAAWNPLHSIGMLWAMLHKIHCI